MSFKDLKLNKPLLRAIAEKGYDNPTLIQERTIPLVLDKKDVIASAQTGTGKTAAFALPILSNLKGHQIGKERDSLEYIKEIPRHKVLYIDPPYNFRQYTSYYFMLNLISDYCEIDNLEKYFSKTFNKDISEEVFMMETGQGLLQVMPEKSAYLSHHRHQAYAVQWLLLGLCGIFILFIASLKRGSAHA